MVADLIRESAFGQVVRLATGKRVFKYPEEIDPQPWIKKYGPRSVADDFRLDPDVADRSAATRHSHANSSSSLDFIKEDEEKNFSSEDSETDGAPAPYIPRGPSESLPREQRFSTQHQRRESDSTKVDEEEGKKSQKNKDEGRKSGSNDSDGEKNQKDPEKGKDYQLVDWEENDPANPRNWSTRKKVFVTFEICLLTFGVYIGSAIYSAGIQSVAMEFGVSEVAATLGLTLFVAGYGVGPLLWSPMSEIPQIGRNPVYIGTLIIFVALQVPTALAYNFGMLLAFRFLTGFFGSPVLATGGASLGDLYSPVYRAYSMGIWGVAAVSGPTAGPLVGGWAAMFEGWRWTIWELLWLSGFALLFLFFLLPETSANNILLRRTVRLRKITGNDNLKCQPEIVSEHMTGKDIVMMSLVRPITLNFTEPMVFLLNLYIALVYGLLYIWFESFPIVFVEIYGFNLGEEGLAFLGILFGAILIIPPFFWYLHKRLQPQFNEDGELQPEKRLPPACVGGFAIVICLFWFGWSSGRTHWIVPIIGSGFFSIGAFLLFNSVLNYLSDAYPEVAASVLAGNDFMRSLFGAGFPLFARAMYTKLGVAWASSLLGFLALVFVPIPFLLYKYGETLRTKHSKHARKDL